MSKQAAAIAKYKSQITRKPRNHAEVALRFASGLGRPWIDANGNVSIDENFIPHYHETEDDTRITFVSYNTPIAFMSRDGLRVWATPESYSVSTSQHQAHLRSALWATGFEETSNAIWMPSLGRGAYYGGRGRRNIEFTEWKRTAADRDQAMSDEANRKPHQRVSRHAASYSYPIAEPIEADPNKLWFKVTDRNGNAYSGGNFSYHLPTADEPGEWTPEFTPVWCAQGYHVTDEPEVWMRGDDCRVWVAEVRGTGITAKGEDKSCWESIRLEREVSHKRARQVSKVAKWARGKAN